MTKLNKQVCKRCRKTQEIYKSWNAWTSTNDVLWDTHKQVVCPIGRRTGDIKTVSYMYLNIEEMNELCPYNLEHLVMNETEQSKTK